MLVAIGAYASYFGFHHRVDAMFHGGAVIVVLGCMLSVLGKNVIFRFFPVAS